MPSEPLGQPKLAYVRPVQPLFFPEQEPEHERLGQNPRHYDLCRLLYETLGRLVGPAGHAVSCDMFLYWNATSPRECRAPDAAVKLGLTQNELVTHLSWKTWELGVPELVVEVLSLSDTRERWTLEEKREAYERIGVSEFVVFDLDEAEGHRLRVWDRVEGDFVERVVEGERSPCVTLSRALAAPIEWLVAPLHQYPTGLRLVSAGAVVPTDHETATIERERRIAEAAAARAESEAARVEVAAARKDADVARARIAELEAALAEARSRVPR